MDISPLVLWNKIKDEEVYLLYGTKDDFQVSELSLTSSEKLTVFESCAERKRRSKSVLVPRTKHKVLRGFSRA